MLTLKGREKELELCFSEQTELKEAIRLLKELKEKNVGFFNKAAVKISYSGTEFDYFSEVLFAEEIKKFFGKRAELCKKHTLTQSEILHSFNPDEVICRIHNGNLRSGEVFVSRGDALVTGDVNPGATVTANGNITVLGALRGVAEIKEKGIVFASVMQPSQIRIGRLCSYNKKSENAGTAIARAEKGEIILNCL